MVRRLIAIVVVMLCTSAHAADTRPSEKSVRELIRVTNAQSMLDTMMVQFDSVMKSAMQQALKDQDVTAKQREQIDEMLYKLDAIFKEEMNWQTLELMFVKIYSESFTQEELDGMLAFYRSPSGEAVLKKMPLVVQNTIVELQKRMGPLLEKLLAVEKETIEKMKAGDRQ